MPQENPRKQYHSTGDSSKASTQADIVNNDFEKYT